MPILLITNQPQTEWAIRLPLLLAPHSLRILASTAVLTGQTSFQVAIVDYDWLDDPVQIVDELRRKQPAAVILVMTISPTWKQSRAMFRAGATDYLPKTSTDPELLTQYCETIQN